MPITAILEFSAVEGEDPLEEYDLVNRELNDGRPSQGAPSSAKGCSRTSTASPRTAAL